MKNAADILWQQIEAEAAWQEERGKEHFFDIPSDAKDPEELYEELMEKIRSGTKSTFLEKK